MAAKRAESVVPGVDTSAEQHKKGDPLASPVIIGRREPAYVLIPKHTSSKGREAVELMQSADVTLDPWQQDVLEGALGLYKGRWASKVVAVLAGRQCGKSEIGLAAALRLATSAPKKLAIIAAHETKTNAELFLRCRAIVETPAFEAYAPKIYSANGQEGIRFNNGSRVRFVARSKHQVRGFSVDLLVIEESMILTDTAWSSLMPALSARDGQIWLIGTAPLPTSEVLRRYAIRGRAGEDKDLAYYEWAAPLDAAPDSLAAIAMANPALGRLRLDWVMEELRGMNPEDYGRERLGWWRENETPSPIPLDLWDRLAFAGPLKTTGTPVFAADVTPTRSHTAICAAALTTDGRPLVELHAMEKGTSWAVGWLQEAVKKFPGATVIVDRSAWAGSFVDELVEAGIDVHEATTRDVTDSAGMFLDGVIGGTFLHRGDPLLRAAVEGAAQRDIGDRWGWARRTKTANVAPLLAASLALWGATTFKPEVPYWILPEEKPVERLVPAGQPDPFGWIISKEGFIDPQEIERQLRNGL